MGGKGFARAVEIFGALRLFAASNALGGRLEQAQKSVARLLQLNPALRVSNLRDAPFRGFRRPTISQ